MTDGRVGPHGGAAMRARSLTLLLTSLLIAVPLTVAMRTWRIITAPQIGGRDAIGRASIHPT
jgi:hypothetical protein